MLSNKIQEQNKFDGFAQAAIGFFQHKRLAGRYTYGSPLYEGDPVNGAELQKHWMADTENYYIYRNETKLIHDHARQIINHGGNFDILADLGCGAAFKSKICPLLMNTLASYAPIDINTEYLEGCTRDMNDIFPMRSVYPVHVDFTKEDISLPGRIFSVMFGNTITNWATLDSIRDILKRLKPFIGDGCFAFTHDTNQDLESLHKAYRHSLFAEATLSPLYMMKRDLQTKDFEPDSWRYLGKWEESTSSYDACMVPLKDMTFSIEGQEVSVKKDEVFIQAALLKIPSDIIQMIVKRAGYDIVDTIYDYQRRIVLQVIKGRK